MIKHDEKKIEEITGKLPLHNDMVVNWEIEGCMKQYAEHMVQQERERLNKEVNGLRKLALYGNDDEPVISYEMAFEDIIKIINCKTCNGKGYVEELEPNECGHCGFSVECDTCEKSIKPNDLTLQEVLLALGKNSDPNWYIEFMTNDSIQIRGGIRLTLPLTLPPEQWDKELQDKIIELLN